MNTLANNIQYLYFAPRQPLKDGCAHPRKQTFKDLRQTSQGTKITNLQDIWKVT